MHDLATVVFERTPEGAAQVSSSSDTLSRALRSVLLAVDGRSSVARYESFLPSLMPLNEKFAVLEQLGLLRRKGSPDAGPVGVTGPALETPVANMRFPDAAPNDSRPEFGPGFEPGLQALSLQAGLIPDNAAGRPRQSLPPDLWDDKAFLATLAHSAAAAVTTHHHVPQPAVAGATTRLEVLLADMEAFLSQAIGLEGLPVAMVVAQISSIEQLRLELPSYSELLRSYGLGAPTETHIAALEAQLASSD